MGYEKLAKQNPQKNLNMPLCPRGTNSFEMRRNHKKHKLSSLGRQRETRYIRNSAKENFM
jgi:hypothetical protein